MAKKYKFLGALTYETKEEVEMKIKEAATAYDVFQPKASKFREMYLGKLAEELAGEDGKEINHHFTQLVDRERIKNLSN